MKTFIALLGLVLLPGLANSQIGSADNFEVFKEGTTWQSIVVTQLGELSFPGISKKWTVTRDVNGKLTLQERTKLSTILTETGKQEWTSASVSLDGQFNCQDFTNMPFSISAHLQKDVSGRFTLVFDVGFKFTVIFVPSTAKIEIRRPLQSNGVTEAPLGSSLQFPSGRINYSNGFVHHTNMKEVVIDPSVPVRFHSVISTAVQKWNNAIGKNVYVTPSVSLTNVVDCLTNRKLCITWQGSSDSFAWIGFGGIASLSYDPEDGSLIGGLVTIQNIRSEEKLLETPEKIISKYTQKDTSMEFFADLMLRKEEFKRYRHPFENDLVEGLLLHEIGHANGFEHDFSGSLSGNTKNVTTSVMDYLPFPVAHLANNLAARDIARLRHVYLNIQLTEYDGCSDEMEKDGNEVNCMKGDWGKPEIWYSTLSSRSLNGVFETVVEYLSGLPVRNYLSIFAKFFSGKLTKPSQLMTITGFLCAQHDLGLIEKVLAENQNIELSCPKKK